MYLWRRLLLHLDICVRGRIAIGDLFSHCDCVACTSNVLVCCAGLRHEPQTRPKAATWMLGAFDLTSTAAYRPHDEQPLNRTISAQTSMFQGRLIENANL